MSSQLEDWEVAIIRAMLGSEEFSKQQIVAYFSRPDRSINQARISEISNDHERYDGISPASSDELNRFVETWRASNSGVYGKPGDEIIPHDRLAPMFKLKRGTQNKLDISENSKVEGKESFDWGSRAKYCKTLAGMANNQGGYILFGVIDQSFEIVGIDQSRMERFDLKKANEYISRSYNQSLEIEKGTFQAGDKFVGFLHVKPSSNKPVICKIDGDGLFSGDVFFRYPGQTTRIRAPELEIILREQETSAEGRLLNLVARLSETGARNAALIDLRNGTVEGERGQFLIDKKLLDQVKFVTRGNFVDDDGAPSLRLVGEVKAINKEPLSFDQKVVSSITEDQIQEAFLKQKCEYDPRTYIQAQTHLQPRWFPIFFFAKEAGLSLKELVDLISGSKSPYTQRISDQISRVRSGKPPAGAPARLSVRHEVNLLTSGDPISISDEHEARSLARAARIIEPSEVSLERVLETLSQIRFQFGNSQKLKAEFRYSLSSIDIHWFRGEVPAE